MTFGRTIAALSLGAALLLPATGTDPHEFRHVLPIRTPAVPQTLPDGAKPVSRVRPVDRAVVEQGVRAMFGAYGTDRSSLEGMLAESFVDRDRLLDNLAERIPRDARINVLGVESVQTLNQYEMSDPAGGGPVRVSTVSAVVRSQLEFNDPTEGFQRLEGRIEYLIEIRQAER